MSSTAKEPKVSHSLRGFARRVKGWVLASLGSPQAFGAMATLARHTRDVTFVDIGCHHGATIQRFLDMAGRFPVVAFDPSEANLEVARRAVRSRAAVTFICAAVADEDGRQNFFGNANEQTSSLLPNASGNLRSFPKDTMTIAVTEVDVIRLDTWAATHLPHGSAIVKCDTQGAEAKVIRGGLRFIRDQVVAFYGEVMLDGMYEGQARFQELRDLLEGECGLILRDVYPCLHDREGRAVQFDALWVRPSLVSTLK